MHVFVLVRSITSTFFFFFLLSSFSPFVQKPSQNVGIESSCVVCVFVLS